MINTKRPSTDDYTQVGFVEAKDTQGNYRNIDHIYDNQGNIVFQQGYLNEYQGADNFGIPAIGKPLLDYTIYGNAVQSATPSPDTPIMPQGTGERTGNLLILNRTYSNSFTTDTTKWMNGAATVNNAGTVYAESEIIGDVIKVTSKNAGYGASFLIEASPNTTYTLSFETDKVSSGSWGGISDRDIDGTVIHHSAIQGKSVTFTTRDNCAFLNVCFRFTPSDGTVTFSNVMLNLGSTALPYEPYGIKIPISSANTTTPVYLGEVETTRRIKKLVLTGKETSWTALSPYYTVSADNVRPWLGCICTHCAYNGIIGGNSNTRLWIKQASFPDYPTLDDFKSYLATQYAAGTPVTIWYVLATPETGIVNEPLMKIGDYADTLSMEQAGVSIPTLNKPNTTVIDVETEVEPSEVDVTYRGSTKPKYSLFLAQNGDSFEAKDGQSLYIGGDL